MSEAELWFYLNQEVIEGKISDADATQIWLREQENDNDTIRAKNKEE